MKRKIVFLLMIVLVLGVFITGCTKVDEKKNQEPVPVETISDKNENVEGKTIDYVLYYRHREKQFLFDEAYSINENDEKLKGITIEEFIINQLINLESFGEYINAIPKGTKLVSIEKNNKMVTINLSGDFIKGQRESSNDTLLSLAAIINSITILPENEQVQFMFDGETIDNINGIDTSKPFEYIQGLYPDK